MSLANVTASFPAMNSRARNGESSASSCANVTLQGQTDWEMCRYNRFMVELDTGRRTLGMPRVEQIALAPTTGQRSGDHPLFRA